MIQRDFGPVAVRIDRGVFDSCSQRDYMRTRQLHVDEGRAYVFGAAEQN